MHERDSSRESCTPALLALASLLCWKQIVDGRLPLSLLLLLLSFFTNVAPPSCIFFSSFSLSLSGLLHSLTSLLYTLTNCTSLALSIIACIVSSFIVLPCKTTFRSPCSKKKKQNKKKQKTKQNKKKNSFFLISFRSPLSLFLSAIGPIHCLLILISMTLSTICVKRIFLFPLRVPFFRVPFKKESKEQRESKREAQRHCVGKGRRNLKKNEQKAKLK